MKTCHPHGRDHVGEWLRLRLIYPHEAERLRGVYGAMQAREDDWIVESRALTYPQIALYLGAFLLACGGLFYFVAARWYEAVEGIARPLAVLGVPFLGLNAAARLLYRRDHQPVAIAFYLAAVGLLPLLLIILLHEAGVLVVPPDTPGQFFQDGSVSNRQMQITTFLACLWSGWLALRTGTAALSTVFTALTLLFGLSVLADFGLREWFDNERWDLVALHAFPLVLAFGALGMAGEGTNRPWLARPPYVAAAILLMLVLELLALDGRTFHYLGFSLQAFQSPDVSDALLLDTVAAMAINGLVFYVVADALDRRGSELQAVAAWLLFTAAPFAMLQPLGYLVRAGEYSPRYDWIYLALSLAIALLAQRRQRRAFYYAGVLNIGASHYLIADHRDWFDKPLWTVAVIAAGLLTLTIGFLLHRHQRLPNARAGSGWPRSPHAPC